MRMDRKQLVTNRSQRIADLTDFRPDYSLNHEKLRFGKGAHMAKLALIYGMRLLPVEDLGEVKEATVVLTNGRTARVAMHLIEGSKEEIEDTFRQSIDAFFEMYPEI